MNATHPDILIVPPQLSTLAKAIAGGTTVADVTARQREAEAREMLQRLGLRATKKRLALAMEYIR